MTRLQHFSRNAGLANCIKLLLLAALAFFALKKDFETGLWLISVPALAIGLAIPFFAREMILRQFSIVRIVMNLVAAAGIVVAVVMRQKSGFEPDWLRVLLTFVIAFYISAYFWTLSDGRIRT